MIDKIWAYISEWAPLVFIGFCLYFAILDNLCLSVAFGFGAVVLSIHDAVCVILGLVLEDKEDLDAWRPF